MTFKTFTLALLLTFGLPWLMLVVVPYGTMRNVEPVFFTMEEDGKDEVYEPRRAGRIKDGAEIYAANGCYICHTQLIRPSFAGSELGRPGWAGFEEKEISMLKEAYRIIYRRGLNTTQALEELEINTR